MKEIISLSEITKEEKTYILKVEREFYSFSIPKSESYSLNIFLDVKNDSKIEINLEENSNLKLVLNSFGNSFNLDINFNLSEYSSLSLFTSDTFISESTIYKTVNLNGEYSNFTGYEYIAAKATKISGDFNVSHNSKNTSANAKYIYLSNKSGFIKRNVISTVKNGMKESSSSENIKGVLLDEKSKIEAKPILIISESDVKASHGCAIGTIDSNEIYYLMSRGLTRADAMKIICKSLINPILREISDEAYLNKIKPILESTMEE